MLAVGGSRGDVNTTLKLEIGTAYLPLCSFPNVFMRIWLHTLLHNSVFFYFCNTDLNICGVLQGSGEIWQWTINFYKSPMMINNITMKAPKVYWQTNNYKCLDTSVIHSQISSPFLEFFCDKFMDWNRILYCDFSIETIEQFKMSVCK